MKKNRSALKRVLSYIKRYSFMLIISIVFSLFIVAISLYIPILVGNAIDFIIAQNNVDFASIIRILAEICVLALFVMVAQWLMSNINNKITYEVVRDIRNEAFEKIQNLPLKYIDGEQNGEIVSKIITDTEQFADGLLLGFSQFFTGIMTIIGTLCFMLMINPVITAVVVLLTPLSLLVARFISKKTYSMFIEQSKIRAEQTTFIDEMIENQKIVKAFTREDKTIKEFDEINSRLEKCSLKATFFSSLTNPGTRFINNLVYAGVALVGAIAVTSVSPAVFGTITVGGLSCFLSYANQYTKPFNEISSVITELQNSLACASRVFELIDTPSQIPDSSTAFVLEKANGNVNFDNVSFSYTKDKKLIENLNLSIMPGQRVAIVGPTGCGKTTLINLLMRFYDVNTGEISVDTTDVRDITRHSLRKNFGMVLQDTWLKSGTIKDNIKMGRSNATDEEVKAAAIACHAHSFIKRLPNGYDTVISDSTTSLSQGQKQLLSISRVMLCLPPMLILDEATSSIDTRTELKIQNAFAKMMEGRTSFIVAHRLSTIREADIILVMNNGNIVEQGNHEQLLNKDGFYAKLYNSQFE